MVTTLNWTWIYNFSVLPKWLYFEYNYISSSNTPIFYILEPKTRNDKIPLELVYVYGEHFYNQVEKIVKNEQFP